MSSVIAVSVGRPQAREWAGIGRTSIDKRNVAGPVAVHPLGLEGDQVSDTEHEVPEHGITVRDMFLALHADRSRLPSLLAIEHLPTKVRDKVATFVLAQGPLLPKAGTVI